MIDTITCPVCQDTLKDPTKLKCTHYTCFECAKKWADMSRPLCPCCRQEYIVADLKVDSKVKHTINSFEQARNDAASIRMPWDHLNHLYSAPKDGSPPQQTQPQPPPDLMMPSSSARLDEASFNLVYLSEAVLDGNSWDNLVYPSEAVSLGYPSEAVSVGYRFTAVSDLVYPSEAVSPVSPSTAASHGNALGSRVTPTSSSLDTGMPFYGEIDSKTIKAPEIPSLPSDVSVRRLPDVLSKSFVKVIKIPSSFIASITKEINVWKLLGREGNKFVIPLLWISEDTSDETYIAIVQDNYQSLQDWLTSTRIFYKYSDKLQIIRRMCVCVSLALHALHTHRLSHMSISVQSIYVNPGATLETSDFILGNFFHVSDDTFMVEKDISDLAQVVVDACLILNVAPEDLYPSMWEFVSLTWMSRPLQDRFRRSAEASKHIIEMSARYSAWDVFRMCSPAPIEKQHVPFFRGPMLWLDRLPYLEEHNEFFHGIDISSLADSCMRSLQREGKMDDPGPYFCRWLFQFMPSFRRDFQGNIFSPLSGDSGNDTLLDALLRTCELTILDESRSVAYLNPEDSDFMDESTPGFCSTSSFVRFTGSHTLTTPMHKPNVYVLCDVHYTQNMNWLYDKIDGDDEEELLFRPNTKFRIHYRITAFDCTITVISLVIELPRDHSKVVVELPRDHSKIIFPKLAADALNLVRPEFLSGTYEYTIDQETSILASQPLNINQIVEHSTKPVVVMGPRDSGKTQALLTAWFHMAYDSKFYPIFISAHEKNIAVRDLVLRNAPDALIKQVLDRRIVVFVDDVPKDWDDAPTEYTVVVSQRSEWGTTTPSHHASCCYFLQPPTMESLIEYANRVAVSKGACEINESFDITYLPPYVTSFSMARRYVEAIMVNSTILTNEKQQTDLQYERVVRFSLDSYFLSLAVRSHFHRNEGMQGDFSEVAKFVRTVARISALAYDPDLGDVVIETAKQYLKHVQQSTKASDYPEERHMVMFIKQTFTKNNLAAFRCGPWYDYLRSEGVLAGLLHSTVSIIPSFPHPQSLDCPSIIQFCCDQLRHDHSMEENVQVVKSLRGIHSPWSVSLLLALSALVEEHHTPLWVTLLPFNESGGTVRVVAAPQVPDSFVCVLNSLSEIMIFSPEQEHIMSPLKGATITTAGCFVNNTPSQLLFLFGDSAGTVHYHSCVPPFQKVRSIPVSSHALTHIEVFTERLVCADSQGNLFFLNHRGEKSPGPSFAGKGRILCVAVEGPWIAITTRKGTTVYDSRQSTTFTVPEIARTVAVLAVGSEDNVVCIGGSLQGNTICVWRQEDERMWSLDGGHTSPVTSVRCAEPRKDYFCSISSGLEVVIWSATRLVVTKVISLVSMLNDVYMTSENKLFITMCTNELQLWDYSSSSSSSLPIIGHPSTQVRQNVAFVDGKWVVAPVEDSTGLGELRVSVWQPPSPFPTEVKIPRIATSETEPAPDAPLSSLCCFSPKHMYYVGYSNQSVDPKPDPTKPKSKPLCIFQQDRFGNRDIIQELYTGEKELNDLISLMVGPDELYLAGELKNGQIIAMQIPKVPFFRKETKKVFPLLLHFEAHKHAPSTLEQISFVRSRTLAAMCKLEGLVALWTLPTEPQEKGRAPCPPHHLLQCADNLHESLECYAVHPCSDSVAFGYLSKFTILNYTKRPHERTQRHLESESSVVAVDLPATLHCLAFSSHGTRVFASAGRFLFVFNSMTPHLGPIYKHDVGASSIRSLHIGDAQHLLSVHNNGEMWRWDSSSLARRTDIQATHQGKRVTYINFSLDKKYLFTVTDDNCASVWSVLEEFRPLWIYDGKKSEGKTKEKNIDFVVGFGHRHDVFIVQGEEILCFDEVVFLEKFKFALPPGGGKIKYLSLSHSGKWLAIGQEAGFLVFDVTNCTLLTHQNKLPPPLTALSFSLDGRYLVAACSETIKVYETRNYQERYSLREHRAHVCEIFFAHRHMFSKDENGVIQCFNCKEEDFVRDSVENLCKTDPNYDELTKEDPFFTTTLSTPSNTPHVSYRIKEVGEDVSQSCKAIATSDGVVVVERWAGKESLKVDWKI